MRMVGNEVPRLVEQLIDLVARLERVVDRLEARERAEASVAVTPDIAPISVAPAASLSDEVSWLYTGWCAQSDHPQSTATIEIAPVRVLVREGGATYGEPVRFVLRDSPQVAEFVRFSRPGSDTALVLPHPDAHYALVMTSVFPTLTREGFEHAEILSALHPVSVQRRPNQDWVTE